MASAILDMLDRPLLWNLSRIGLDLAFGLYRKPIQIMRESGFLKGQPSVLDIGCGIGQFASITAGRYLGIDMNQRYISYAQSRPHRDAVSFRCDDVTRLVEEGEKFDIVLMMNILHHISNEQVVKLLNTASCLAKRCIINVEPVTEQSNAIGRWFAKNDRGDYIRPTDELLAFYNHPESGLRLCRSQEIKMGPLKERIIFAESTLGIK